MAHSLGHPQGHAVSGRHSKAFAIGIGLNIAFVVIEIIYGLIANSSVLLADAGHNASDNLSLIFV
jgi:cobalt-zinc-cadmium efflux system protein